MKKLFLFLLFLSFLGMSGSALAVEGLPTGLDGPLGTVTTGNMFVELVFDVIDWLFVIFILAAVVFVVLAAFQFITGGGDAQQVAQARQKLIWAAVAVIVATLARAIPTVVNNIISP